MMRFRKLDSSGDWTFGHGMSCVAEEENAIELEIATRVREWCNDCFFAMDRGIDYQNLLEVGQQKRLIFAIKCVILTCYGVVGINKEPDILIRNGRNYFITYDVKTIYSDSFISEIGL